jgi:choline dehydrogenase-like flavoprotein
MTTPPPVTRLSDAASAPSYDVVVVGSGACGAFAARELAAHGLRVAVLEAGPAVAPELLDPPGDPHPLLHESLVPERQRRQAQHPDFFRRNPRLFVDDVDHPYTTPADAPFNWIRGRQVGGRTLTWGGVTLRLSPHELEGPAAGDPWPLTYQELAPYYDEVERFLGVRGACDGVPQLPDGCFRPPCPMTPGEERLKAAVEARWPDRRVVASRGVAPRDEGDPLTAWPRHTSQHGALAAALASGLVTLVPDAVVREILVDPDTAKGRGVAAIDAASGVVYEVGARAVVLAASTLESTRILLASRPRQHPEGLGNSSGLLGCFLMDHPVTSIYGAIPDLPSLPAPPPLRGPEGVVIPRFRNLGPSLAGFAGGYGVFGGVQRRAFNSRVFSRGPAKVVLQAYGEMQPRRDNRVTLDPETVDRFGVPSLHIQCRWSDNERALLRDMEQTLAELLAALGARVASDPAKVPIPGTMVHEVGTARMGRDPRQSVLDPHNRCWDADNVLVVDGACWPSAGWQNPTLTMMALAVRACRRLATSFGSAAGRAG